MARPARRANNAIALTLVIVITLIGIVWKAGDVGQVLEPAATQEQSSTTDPNQQLLVPPQQDDLGEALVKTVWITLFVLGVIILAALGFKRFWGDRLNQTATADITIVGRRYISPKQSLALIRVRDRDLLIGITEHSIQLLTDLTGPTDTDPPELYPTEGEL